MTSPSMNRFGLVQQQPEDESRILALEKEVARLTKEVQRQQKELTKAQMNA